MQRKTEFAVFFGQDSHKGDHRKFLLSNQRFQSLKNSYFSVLTYAGNGKICANHLKGLIFLEECGTIKSVIYE